ncbi:GNAT family N-acetyltransferase [Oricola sp.]|uniref:GNAT family N-acetyltransferase n=1 Tax=Oricola sp. TaxID=1979950 RepID=UPI003BA9733C
MIEISTIEGEDEALEQRLQGMLDTHAERNGTAFDPQTVGFVARDGDGAFLGGLYDRGQLGWFFIKLLALEARARQTGVGGRLLAEAEAHARASGLIGVFLDTYEFEAPGFYAKLGYKEFGRLPPVGGHPQRMWFAKTFGVEETN